MATKAVLKGHFNTGDKPTETQFASLIDSYPSFDDDFALKYVKVEVSSAEILALNVTPKVLVAAPGVGKIVLPITVFYNYHYGTVAYATNMDVAISYASNPSVSLMIYGGNILEGSVDLQILQTGSTLEPTINTNTGLVAYARTANPITGDGTLDIHLWYTEVTL